MTHLDRSPRVWTRLFVWLGVENGEWQEGGIKIYGEWQEGGVARRGNQNTVIFFPCKLQYWDSPSDVRFRGIYFAKNLSRYS